MSKAEILFDAITGIRPELVEEAQNYRFRRRSLWRQVRPYVAAAACLALVLAVGWNALRFGGMGGGDAGDPGNTSGNISGDAGGYGGTATAPADPGSDGTADSETAPPDSGMGGVTVTATVAEVREDGILIRVLSGAQDLIGETFLLPADGITAAPEVAAGDTVTVDWCGRIDRDREPPVFLEEITVAAVQP